MKNFLASTAIVLALGGTAYAAPVQFNAYQSQATDIQASDFIGQTIYASDTDFTADQSVKPGAEKDWANVGEINEVIMGRDGAVKAVVLGVGGFLGMGEKNVAVSMNDVKFVKNGDGPDDYFLVINANKDTLAKAPAFKMPEEVRQAQADAANASKTNTADNTMTAPSLVQPGDTTADQTAATTDSTAAKPADTANNDKVTEPATDQAANTMKKPSVTANEQAVDNSENPDTQTTASTTNNNAVQGTMSDRTLLTRPEVARDGYQAAQATELTADKLEGTRVYGAKDEDVGEVNKLVLDDKGQVKLIVLDIGGFLGIGEHQIAVTPGELNIVRDAKGDDFRIYIDANKESLKAQPEYHAAN